MDSKTLTKEQLRLLVRFIHSRGFKEDVVVLEILDHFACKVEEILEQHPDLIFEEVMRRAHASFGVMGFRPIAASFEVQAKVRYTTLFWTNFKSVISKPLSLIFLPLIGIVYFRLFILADKLGFRHFLEMNDALTGLGLLWAVLNITLLLRIKNGEVGHPFIKATLGAGHTTLAGSTIIYFFLPMLQGISKSAYVWIPATILAVYLVYILARFIAASNVLKKAKNDIAEIKKMAIA